MFQAHLRHILRQEGPLRASSVSLAHSCIGSDPADRPNCHRKKKGHKNRNSSVPCGNIIWQSPDSWNLVFLPCPCLLNDSSSYISVSFLSMSSPSPLSLFARFLCSISVNQCPLCILTNLNLVWHGVEGIGADQQDQAFDQRKDEQS